MFGSLRLIAGALQGLLVQLTDLRQAFEDRPDETPQEPLDLSTITDRLDAIEIGSARWRAEAEATLLKADALFKNARNAEERTRSKNKAIREDEYESSEFAEAVESWIQARDAEGPENGAPGVEVHSRKASAVRAKFR